MTSYSLYDKKKVIAIVGATGQQGGALLRAILDEGPKSRFVARAITRDAKSDKAEALKKMGVEVVEADANDEAALTSAIQNCYGMYCVTVANFQEYEKEKQQAETMAKAARNAGIRHVIWSTLEDTRKRAPIGTTSMPTVGGKYNVPHFDLKGEADEYFADLPTTYFTTVFYWENFFAFFPPRKGADGKYYLSVPMGDKKLGSMSIDDIGKCALSIFKRPDYINRRVGITGEALPLTAFVAKMTKALGKEIIYAPVGHDDFRNLGFPGAVELGNMFQYWHDYERDFFGIRSIDQARKLNPDLMSFDTWLAKNKNKIPVE